MNEQTPDWETKIFTEMKEHPDLMKKVITIVKHEVDCIRQDFIDTSSLSTRSSRKRSRELYWDDILKDTGINFEDEFEDEFVTPEMFTRLSSTQKHTFFLQRNVLHKKDIDIVMAKFEEAQCGKIMPSPSEMTWADAVKILDGQISTDETKLMENLPESVDTDEILSNLDSTFENNSEMDASIRIIFIL